MKLWKILIMCFLKLAKNSSKIGDKISVDKLERAMFEHILVRHIMFGEDFQAGLIAELLLFYQNVHIHLDRGSLYCMIKFIGPDNLLHLMSRNDVKITFQNDAFVGYSQNNGFIETHTFEAFTIRKAKPNKGASRKAESDFDIVLDSFPRAIGANFSAKKFANRFMDRVSFKQLASNKLHSRGIPGLATEDLKDARYTREVVRRSLNHLAPTYNQPDNFRFEIIDLGESFIIDTNIDFDTINKNSSESSKNITPILLATHIIDVRADMTISSECMSELATTPIIHDLAKIKYGSLLSKRNHSNEQINLFQNIVFDQARNIRGSIDSGEHSFDDFLRVLDNSHKFKNWLKEAHPSKELLSEYMRSATDKTWADKLPFKGLRWAFFTGAGLAVDATLKSPGIGTISGIGLSAADAFLVEKFLKGWRPHQFVDTYLKPFV